MGPGIGPPLSAENVDHLLSEQSIAGLGRTSTGRQAAKPRYQGDCVQYAKTSDDVNIAYWTMGEGPPLVVAQGFLWLSVALVQRRVIGGSKNDILDSYYKWSSSFAGRLHFLPLRVSEK
jgi:hypothetical protein